MGGDHARILSRKGRHHGLVCFTLSLVSAALGLRLDQVEFVVCLDLLEGLREQFADVFLLQAHRGADASVAAMV